MEMNRNYYQKVVAVLQKNQHLVGQLFDFDFNKTPLLISNNSNTNTDLATVNTTNTKEFSLYAKQLLAKHNAVASVGGYLEERVIYRGRPLFDQDNRCIHLGIDINTKAGATIFTPLDSRVHSFADNDRNGDYGPTIILEHELDNMTFYTLYGHLSRNSLIGLSNKTILAKGTPFAQLGRSSENGNWPPHLHFQLILDMGKHSGDFPGVCTREQLEHFRYICPDPNLILQIDLLEKTTQV